MFTPLLLSAILLCNSVRGVPRSAEPTVANPSPVRPVAEITPAPTMPPVVELLRRGGSNPAVVPRDDSDLMKRLACGAYYVTCNTGSCCFLGQECYKNSAGADLCRYPGAIDYSSLLSSLTAIGGNSYNYDAMYSSILSSYMDLFTNFQGAGTTGGYNEPVSTAGAGSSGSNSGSGSSPGSGDTTTTNNGGKKKSNTGMIAGIAVGSVAGVAIVGAIVWYCCRKKRNPTPPLQQYPQPQTAYAAQTAQVDIKPPQAYQFQHQPPPTEVGGAGIVPQQQVPPGNAVYAAQGAGYQGPISPPPPRPSAQEMSGDTQFLPPQQHQQQPQYGLPRNGTPGPLIEMDAGQQR